MKIGVPRETKDQEFRVGMTPDGVRALVEDGHRLVVERGAGEGSGFPDAAYLEAGAALVGAEEAWAEPDLVVHTGDVSHLSRPEEFAQARDLLREIHVDRVHTIPGEHDTIDEGVNGYLNFFDHDGNGNSWYSFDQGGVQHGGTLETFMVTLRTLQDATEHGKRRSC